MVAKGKKNIGNGIIHNGWSRRMDGILKNKNYDDKAIRCIFKCEN